MKVQSFLLIVLSYFLSISSQVNILDSGGVEINPTLINQVSRLRVYAFLESTIPQNGSIRVVFPADIVKVPQSTNCIMVQPTSIAVQCTTSTSVDGLIQVTATIKQQIDGFFSLEIPGFTNPSSTAETDSFKIYTLDDSGTIMDQQTDSIILQATRGALQQIILSSSSVYVGEVADLTVTLKTSNIVPMNGKLRVTFPYWNPEAQGTIYLQYSYITNPSNVVCVPNSGTPIIGGSSLPCVFDSSTQTLTLSNIFSQQVVAGSDISFIIRGVKNPVSTQPVTNIQVYTVDSSAKQGTIDWAAGTLTASTAGRIVTTNAKPNSTLVQALTQYRLEFVVPVPLSAGCIIEIVFPSQITLGSELQEINAFGLPNAQRQLTGSLDRSRNSLVISNACPAYRDNTNTAILFLNQIRNPFTALTTDQIQVHISDSEQRLVCSTINGGNGPRVTTTPGTLSIGKVVPEVTTEISQITTVLLTLQPQHALAANTQIVVELADEFSMVGANCYFTGVSTNMLPSQQSCEYRITGGSRQVIINEALTVDYVPSGGSLIQFKLHNMRLPPSEGPTGLWTFTLSSFYSGAYYQVDTETAADLFEATRAALGGATVAPDSVVANQVCTYTFTIQNSNLILRGGTIIINLPPEIKLPSLSSASCLNPSSNFPSTPSCQFNATSITIKNGFSSSSFDSADKGALVIQVSGLQNPRSLQTSQSFQIFTYDFRGYMIEYKKDQMAIQMTDTRKVLQATVTPSMSVVGGYAQYQFSVQPATPLINGDIISITFPQEFNIPIVNTLKSCTGVQGLKAGSLVCKVTGPYVLQVAVAFADPAASYQGLLSFTMLGVQNPPTTEPTSPFQVQLLDSTSALINDNDPLLTTFSVQMSQGATIKNITIINQSRKSFTMTAFTFSMIAEVPIPKNAIIVISFPEQIALNDTYTGCQLSNKNAETSCLFDADKRIITITQVTDVTIETGATLQITLYGLINSRVAAPTDTFTFEVKTEKGFAVMQQMKGLSVTNDCDYPCLTCDSSTPSKCLTCETDSLYALFLNGQCLQQCPSNYYPKEYQCYKCDPSCAECSDGGTKCLKCFKGMFLQGNTCVKQCLTDVEYQNETTQSCQSCEAPCATCTTSVSTCSSCLQITDQKLFYKSQCLSKCPAGVTVLQDNHCVDCSQNCATCNGLPEVCTSCKEGMKLDVTDSVCKETCPLGTTIQVGNTCQPCDTNCKTCASTDRSYCLSCQFGLNFWESQHECLVNCPNRTILLTENKVPYCRDCNVGCLECQNSTSYCTKCDQDHVFFKFTCVSSCPESYRRLSPTRNICVKEREDCKYGYAYNDFGECELIAQVCLDGYVLNGKLNRCIPVPGAYAPLVYLIFAGLCTAYLLYHYKKGTITDKYELITLLITVYTHIQALSYIVMFCLSIALDYKLVTAIHLTTLFTMAIMNVAFGLYMHYKLRKEDSAFRFWVDQHQQVYTVFKYIVLAFSFKSMRLFYCKFFIKKPWFSATFNNHYATVIRPLFIATVLNFLLQVGPIILMDAYNLMFIPWGYQIMVMSIDNMILALVTFVLEIVEFAYFKRMAVEEGDLIMKGAHSRGGLLKGQRGQVNVMSAFPEDEDSGMVGLNVLSAGPGEGYLSEKREEELLQLESAYLTRDGYRKVLQDRAQERRVSQGGVHDATSGGLISQRNQMMIAKDKYLDPDDIFVSALSGRHSHAVKNESKSKEAQVLENIVKRLKEEQKFNQMFSEPASEKGEYESEEQRALVETMDMPANGMRLPPTGRASRRQLNRDPSVKKKLRVDETRGRIENNLSQRAKLTSKSQAQLIGELMQERIMNEVAGLSREEANLNQQSITTHQAGIIEEEQHMDPRLLDSARTEKFHKYQQERVRFDQQPKTSSALAKNSNADTVERAKQQSMAQLSAGSPSRSLSPSRQGGPKDVSCEQEDHPFVSLLDERVWYERDRRDYHVYYSEFYAKLKKEHKERNNTKINGLPFKRKWHSFDGDLLREVYDDMGPMSDFESELSHESEPPFHNRFKMKDPQYLARLELFRQQIKSKYLFNNGYTQETCERKDNQTRDKNVTRRTQTYERDIAIGYDPFDREYDELVGQSDDRLPEYDPQFTKNIFTNLLENLSSMSSSQQLSDFDFENGKKRRRGKLITRENFTMEDIMGEFDIDDRGDIIFPPSHKEGVLIDKQGRRVNKHGYLIDKRSNIINQDGDLMFAFKELDQYEDLPQPYKFEKRRKQLLMKRQRSEKFELTIENAEARRLFDIDQVLNNEDEQVEEEFNKLKGMSRPSSVDSLVGEKGVRKSGENVLSSDQDDNGLSSRRKGSIFHIKTKPQPEGPKIKEKLTAADRRAIRMAKAYGGEPPVKKKKVPKKKKLAEEEDDDLPLTDRLYPSLAHREEERVKKIAKVAYRQGLPEDSEDTADGLGFQQFFKKQMQELEMNRASAKEEFNRNAALYGQLSFAENSAEQRKQQLINENAIDGPLPGQTSISNLGLGILTMGRDSEQTLALPASTTNKLRESSTSTNKVLMGGLSLQQQPVSSSFYGINNNSLPEMPENQQNQNIEEFKQEQQQQMIEAVEPLKETSLVNFKETSILNIEGPVLQQEQPVFEQQLPKQKSIASSGGSIHSSNNNNVLPATKSSALTTYNNLNFGFGRPTSGSGVVEASEVVVNGGGNVGRIYRRPIQKSESENQQIQQLRLNHQLSMQQSQMRHLQQYQQMANPQQVVHNFYPQSSSSLVHQNNNISSIQDMEAATTILQNPQYIREQQNESLIPGKMRQNPSATINEGGQASKPTFRKFDFYLPSSKNGGAKGKKQKGRDLSFSNVGQMQMQNSSRIKDLEKLYLKKYPGHSAAQAPTVTQMHVNEKSAQYFNQYVNNPVDSQTSANQLQYATGNPSQVQLARNLKSAGSGRGLVNQGAAMSVGSDFSGSTTKIGSGIQLGTSFHVGSKLPQPFGVIGGGGSSGRPQSSMVNIPKRDQLGRMAKLQTVNSEGADVFEGVAKVLNNIERLRSSGIEEDDKARVQQPFSNDFEENNMNLATTTFDGTSMAAFGGNQNVIQEQPMNFFQQENMIPKYGDTGELPPRDAQVLSSASTLAKYNAPKNINPKVLQSHEDAWL